MALTNLHTDWMRGSYLADRNDFVKQREGDALYALVLSGEQGLTFPVPGRPTPQGIQPYLDDLGGGRFSLAVGYGFDLYKNSVSDIVAFLGQVGITLSPADINSLNNRNALMPSQLKANLSFTLGNEMTASNLMGLYLEQRAETQLDTVLGYHLAESKERAALVSLVYSGGTGIIGANLRTALTGDNRAEAWYEIRYRSNADAQHAPRRIDESKLFNLYDNPGQGVSEAEAKEVLRMYTIHQPEIQEYESRFSTLFPTGGTDTIVFQIIGAKTTLIPIYNAGKAIDGEVLVGNEFGNILDEYGRLVLDKNDLMFGEGGNDYLYGHGGTDVLYGGAGEDRLYGGAGDDRLEGGAGFDTYRWSTGDGHDRIEDSDADGVIFVNGQMLAGGVKKVGHTDWISPDGTIKYEMSGTDLVVKLNGTTIMTVNENFQSGQFGIRLMDAPTIATDAPATTRTIVGDFQPLDIDLVEEGVQIGYDDLGNVIQDPQSPGDRSDLLNGSENNDQMNGGALRDRLTALGGSDMLTGGSQNDVLIGQDGNDQLFADQLVTVSSLVSFENFGGTVGTGAPGDFLTGGIHDDVLRGGADDLNAEERIARHMICCSLVTGNVERTKHTRACREFSPHLSIRNVIRAVICSVY